MSDEHLMQLTTSVAPAKTFAIDEEPYELLGMDHLSADKEAEVTASFSRYEKIVDAMGDKDVSKDVAKAAALRMREIRMDILSAMTTAPREVLEKLPLSGQVQIMNALAADVGVDPVEE